MRKFSKAACALLVAASPLTGLGAEVQSLGDTFPELPADSPEDRVSNPIMVTGSKVTKETVQTFVHEVGAEGPNEQLARWNKPICPAVQGLKPEYSAYVEGMIIALAREVQVEVADPGCKVNLLVAFESEPGDFISSLNDDRSYLFDSMSVPDRQRLAESTNAVTTWSHIETKSAHGSRLNSTLGDSGLYDLRIGRLASSPALRKYTNSSIEKATRQEINANFITIDLEQIDGKTMQQLADYVAMLALAQIDVAEPIDAGNTILNLFHDPAGAPSGLTNWDVAYVRSLYDTNIRQSAHMQRSTMARLVRRELEDVADE